MEKARQKLLKRLMGPGTDRIYRLTAFEPHPAARDIPDPHGGSLETYLHCAGIIRSGAQASSAHLLADEKMTF